MPEFYPDEFLLCALFAGRYLFGVPAKAGEKDDAVSMRSVDELAALHFGFSNRGPGYRIRAPFERSINGRKSFPTNGRLESFSVFFYARHCGQIVA